MSGAEKLPNENSPEENIDRALNWREVIDFTEAVIWPATDHLRGVNFRQNAQQRSKTRLRRRVVETEGYHGPERIMIEAKTHRKNFITTEEGERQRLCEVTVTLEEVRTELKEGMAQVLDQDNWEEKRLKNSDSWWHDDDRDWQPWEIRVFCFSNDPNFPFYKIYNLEAQDEEEREPIDRTMWEYVAQDRPETDNELDTHINERENELERIISYRECLEVRAALIRFGVPAEVMSPGQV